MVPVCSLYGSCANVPSEKWERRADEKNAPDSHVHLEKPQKRPSSFALQR